MIPTVPTQAQLHQQVETLQRHIAELETAELERHQAQIALQFSETRYRRLFETAQDGILILDADTGQIMDVNPFLMKMLGYSHAELLGQQLWEIGPFKDIAAARAAFSELQSSGYIRYEDLPLETRDGRRMNVEFVSNVYWVDQQRVIQCNIRDITARKQAEAALAEAMSDLQERNQALDAFAYMVAHDLKNPIHVIISYAELLTQGFDLSDAERQRCLRAIDQMGYKANAIINELLLLARLSKSEVEAAPLDMVRLVAGSLSRLDNHIDDTGAEIRWSDAATWPTALGHDQWVEEVWVNYLSNALKYGHTLDAAPCIELGAAVQPDGLVRYWVHDYGPGIAAEVQAQLFTPFPRLAQVRPNGHGLGLSIVRRIVEKLGGQVGLESQEGEGSTFYFELPAAH